MYKIYATKIKTFNSTNDHKKRFGNKNYHVFENVHSNSSHTNKPGERERERENWMQPLPKCHVLFLPGGDHENHHKILYTIIVCKMWGAHSGYIEFTLSFNFPCFLP